MKLSLCLDPGRRWPAASIPPRQALDQIDILARTVLPSLTDGR